MTIKHFSRLRPRLGKPLLHPVWPRASAGPSREKACRCWARTARRSSFQSPAGRISAGKPRLNHCGAGFGPDQAASDDDREIAMSVELGGLVFPMFDEGGKLKNYIFVSARMVVAQGKDPWKYREQAHFIRDAVVRAAHRVSFNAKGNYNKL